MPAVRLATDRWRGVGQCIERLPVAVATHPGVNFCRRLPCRPAHGLWQAACCRAANVTAKARLAGVIGWPVSHSRSPRLHNHWLARHGIDGAYVPLPVRPEDLAAAVVGLRAAGFRGANVTVPHKVAVAALCDTLTGGRTGRRRGEHAAVHARTASSATTRTAPASWPTCAPHCARPPGPALLLGAGGAARAIAAALLAAGVPVTVANRSPDRAASLAAALPGLHTVPWADRHALAGIALLVNTTSLGMAGQPPLEMDLAAAPAGMAVCDIVYAPLETPLLTPGAGARAARGGRPRACCCTRPCPASPPGSASCRRWTRRCTTWLPAGPCA